MRKGGSRVRARLSAPAVTRFGEFVVNSDRVTEELDRDSRATVCLTRSRSRSSCSTARARSCWRTTGAREDLAVLGEPVGGVKGLFTHGLELVDEDGHPLRTARDPVGAHAAHGGGAQRLRDGRSRSDANRGAVWINVATQPLRRRRRRRSPGSSARSSTSPSSDATRPHSARRRSASASSPRTRPTSCTASRSVSSPRFEYVNPAVETALGYTPQEFYDDPSLIVRVTHADDVDARARARRPAGSTTSNPLQLRMTRRDGTLIWTEHKVVPLRTADGTVFAATGIARDVTALKVKEAFLSHRALHDPLTGLPNRVLLLDRLEAALSRIRRHKSWLAVLYLDLDRFKTVNDNLGHEVGDRLLQVVGPSPAGHAAPVRQRRPPRWRRVRRDPARPARPGRGDAGGRAAARGDRGAGRPRARARSVTTVSIGVAGANDGDASAGELLRRADFAMYTRQGPRSAARDRARTPDRDPTR